MGGANKSTGGANKEQLPGLRLQSTLQGCKIQLCILHLRNRLQRSLRRVAKRKVGRRTGRRTRCDARDEASTPSQLLLSLLPTAATSRAVKQGTLSTSVSACGDSTWCNFSPPPPISSHNILDHPSQFILIRAIGVLVKGTVI